MSNWTNDPLRDNPRFEKIRTIGRGSHSFVQLARDRSTGEHVAVKFIARGWDSKQTKYVLRELLIHQELTLSRHPHIVEFREAFLTPGYLAVVMEYVDGEDLQQFLANTGGRVTEPLARFIFQQLVLALDFCHRRGKISRDVKLANTLLALAPNQLPLVKLCDFGFSKDTMRHSMPQSQVGTALFVAPEVMHNFKSARYDGAAADVWSSGIVLFILLFGRHPFLKHEDLQLPEQQQMLKLFTRVMQSEWTMTADEEASITRECRDLLGHLLQTNPQQRYTIQQMLSHPWFLQGLPQGAAVMNTLILREEYRLRPKQSAQELEQLVKAAQTVDIQALNTRFTPDATPTTSAASGQQQQQQQQQPAMSGAPAWQTAPISMNGTQQQQQQQWSAAGGVDGMQHDSGAAAAAAASAGMMYQPVYNQYQQPQVSPVGSPLMPAAYQQYQESNASNAFVSASHASNAFVPASNASNAAYYSHDNNLQGWQDPQHAQQQQFMQQQQQQLVQQQAMQQQQLQQQQAMQQQQALQQQAMQQQAMQQQQQQAMQQQQQQQQQQQAAASRLSNDGSSSGGYVRLLQRNDCQVPLTQDQSQLQQQQLQQQQAQQQLQQFQQQLQQQGGMPVSKAELDRLDTNDLAAFLLPDGDVGNPTFDAFSFASVSSLPVLPSGHLDAMLLGRNPASPSPAQSAPANLFRDDSNGGVTSSAPGDAAVPSTSSGGNPFGPPSPGARHRLAAVTRPGLGPGGIDPQQLAALQQVAASSAAAAQQQGQQAGQQPPVAGQLPAVGLDEDDFSAFLVDEEERHPGDGLRVSSAQMDLRALSDLLMGNSSEQLLEGSLWHKICHDLSFTAKHQLDLAALKDMSITDFKH